jgi:hypothetical protein
MFLVAVMHATVTKKCLRPLAIKARGGTEHGGGKKQRRNEGRQRRKKTRQRGRKEDRKEKN